MAAGDGGLQFPGIGRSPALGFDTVEGLVDAVRTFLRDFPEENRLLPSVESSDPYIRLCIAMIVDDFNRTPPVTNFRLNSFPSYYLLIIGSVIQVLRSAGLKYSRNRLNYNEGGVQVATSDKAGDYQSWIASFFNEYERKKRELKIAINLRQAFGSMPSEYVFLDRDLFF